MDSSNNARMTKGMGDHTWRLDEYKAKVRRLFPALPSDYVDAGSISRVDALAFGYFLECYPRRVIVMDIGALVSASAVHFAGRPEVLKVISVGPNPEIVAEINDESDPPDPNVDRASLQNLRALDVAQAVLAEFADERHKVELRAGTSGNSRAGSHGSALAGLETLEIPAIESSDGVSLVAFIEGVHSKDGVETTLEAIFEKHPYAVAVLDDCRGYCGPFVQAGVVSFMDKALETYHFQPFGDLGPSLATSGLGIVYPGMVAAETKQTLVEFSELFGDRLDLLRLLRREEELIGAVNWYKNAADKYKKQAERLRRRNSRLIAEYSSQNTPASTLADKALRVPGVEKLVRSELIRTLVPWKPSGTMGRRAGGPHP